MRFAGSAVLASLPGVAGALALVLAARAVVAGELSAAPAVSSQPGDNVVLLWDEAILQGIRGSKPGPTVAARALAVVHTAMYDAWTAYDSRAQPTRPQVAWRRPPQEATQANVAEAVSFAAYRALADLLPADAAMFGALLTTLGYDPTDTSTDPSTPAGVGNAAAGSVLDFRHSDGSNQLGDLHAGAYSDYTGYVPVNSASQIVDPNRWQPLQIVSGGQPVVQSYTTPQWGLVTPFSLRSGDEHRPGPPARFPDGEYRRQAAEILELSAGLTDEQKVTAEYFADGPGTEFPPGHWALFGQFVSRRDGHAVAEDVKMFFALANALLDASICAWDAKRVYDSERPGTAIHFLYAGQLVRAWGGPFAGTQTIRGEDWRPYQLAGVVTPPFPEFFSGHSVFSASAAEVLRSFTGSDAFGFSVVIPAGSSAGEPGLVPAEELTLSFPTFSDAVDSAGMSRRYGGIHFAQGDLTGRALGRTVGAQAWQLAQAYFEGTAGRGPIVRPPRVRPASRVIRRN